MRQDVAEVVGCLLDFVELTVKVGLMNNVVWFKEVDVTIDVLIGSCSSIIGQLFVYADDVGLVLLNGVL